MHPVPPRAPEHVAAFYRTTDYFLDQVTAFVAEGLAAGEDVIVLGTNAHWNAIAARLEQAGVAHGRAASEGRLHLLDAEDILEQITIDGRISVEAFAAVLQPLLSADAPQRLYGEVVSLLAQRGNVDDAAAIETLGHEVARDRQIRILCGYHLGTPSRLTGEEIARLERLHDGASFEDSRSEAIAPGPDRPMVLVADDYEDALEMYGEYLRFAGFRVVLARDGEEAVRIAGEHEPDLILLDIRMPRMTGTAALRELRRDPRFEKVPILALTAHALDSERNAILADGFDGVISKPCLPDQLANTVRLTLSKSIVK